MLLHNRSGETYPVSFLTLQPYDIQHQMHDWEQGFDWSIYFSQREIEVYKMVICGNAVIQGAISFEGKEDHVWVHLIESIPPQRKEFSGVGLHLLAFACKRSSELGFGGAVALQSKIKPRLIHYYTSIVGASHFGGGLIIVDETVAKRFIMLYFP